MLAGMAVARSEVEVVATAWQNEALMPRKPSKLRVALLGTRGVPASYSGFETCAEELGARLAARGHAVSVYCRVPHISYPRPRLPRA